MQAHQTQFSSLSDDDIEAAPRRWLPEVDPRIPLLHIPFRFLDWIWRGIRWFWIVVVIGAILVPEFAAALTSKDTLLEVLSEPTQWLIVRGAREHPLIAFGVVGCVTLFIVLCGRAHVALDLEARLDPLRNEYIIERIARLSADQLGVPHYRADAPYLDRTDTLTHVDATAAARQLLRARATHRPGAPLGICIFGRPLQGKTRLAWEAMRTELTGWTLIRWPHTTSSSKPIDLAPLRGRRVVLWLDDLHDYATEADAFTLRDLPRRFATANISLIIVATCRDRDDAELARQYLGTLIERLEEIHPDDITGDQAKTLAIGLAVGSERTADDYLGDWDHRTPGSLVLGVKRLRDSRFPRLNPKEAQLVLWSLQLLRSAQIISFSESRVRATCDTVFRWPLIADAQWEAALGALGDYLTVHSFLDDNGVLQRELRIIADIYLEDGIPSYYGWNVDPTVAWPQLQQALTKTQDATALVSLGGAYHMYPRADSLQLKEHAASCYRAALHIYSAERTPLDWVKAQYNLSVTLAAQADLLAPGSPRRRQCLTEAMNGFQDVVNVCLSRYTKTRSEGWLKRARQSEQSREMVEKVWLKDIQVQDDQKP